MPTAPTRVKRKGFSVLVKVEALEERRLFSTAYHLTFDDEFNTFDASKWKTSDYWGNRTLSGNGEQQWYSDTAHNGYNPFSVSGDGILTITAEPTPAGVYSNNLPYVSGEITTAQRYYQQYGYFEVRAKLPAGKGLWPAFWLLPSNGSWPPEYDIFEMLGHDTDSIYQTSHWKGSAGDHRSAGGNYAGQVDAATGFHTYGFEWDAKEVKWYVDGVLTQTQINRVNMPMYTLINLAVGGYWPGNPDASTPFPAHMELDYMRIYSADPNVAEVTPQAGYSLSANLPIAVGDYVPPAQPAAPLPSGWAGYDIGSPTLAGSSAYYKTSTYTLRSGGYDIDGTADEFHFAAKDFGGDGTLRASVMGTLNTNADAKAGVMFRAAASADAAFVGLFLTPGRRLAFQYRTASGATATTTWTTGKEDPLWLRIVRSGDTYTAAYSSTGSTWTTAGSVTIAMGTTLKAGLALSSHDAALETVSSFQNVALLQSIPKAPTDLGVTVNASGKPVLSWADNSNNETYFRIQRSTNGSTYSDLASTVTNVSTYTDTSAVAGTLYYYRVRAANPAGTSAFTNVVSIVAGTTSNAAPTISTPPAGSPNPVAGTTTTLSVLGADDGGEANLTYTWSVSGPAAVSFSSNATNAAKTTLATFSRAGAYSFTVLVKDAAGLSSSSTVEVTVDQTLTSIAVSPASTTVYTNGTAQFTAAAFDQFGQAMAAAPTFAWSVISGGGTVSSAGLYTAPATAGNATVQAAVGAVAGTAGVTIASTSTTYQAESATLGGGATVGSSYGGYTGSGYVGLPKRKSYVNWNVSAASAGTYTLSFRYALASTSARTLELKVNGQTISGGVTFSDTGSWSTWAVVTVTVTLKSGTNAIRLTSSALNSGNIDSLTVAPV